MIKNGNLAAAIIKPDYVLTPEGLKKGWGVRIEEGRIACVGPWDTPVSYTHLDVYKRQPLSNEQLDILEKAFHPISALNKVRTGRETVNLEKGKSLQDIEVDSVTLSDDCIEKLADMVVKRMTSIS